MAEENLDALCDLLNDDDEEDLPVEPAARDKQVNLCHSIDPGQLIKRN